MEQELAIKLQEDGIHYQTQVEVPIAIADFYFSLESRPLLMFVDGRLHHGTAQMEKDEELRLLLRKRGYRILELYYDSYSDKKRDQLYQEILNSIGAIRASVTTVSCADFRSKAPRHVSLPSRILRHQ